MHGVYACYLEGKKGSFGVDLPALKAQILRSLEQAEQAIERLCSGG